mgnify:CR=1 FL=1
MGLFCIKNYFTKSVDIGNRNHYFIVLIKLKEIKMNKNEKLNKLELEYIHQELSREYWKYLSDKDKEPIFLKNLLNKVNKQINEL